MSDAVLEIRYSRLVVLPPIGKQKNYPHAGPHRDLCPGTRPTAGTGQNRLETAHGSSRSVRAKQAIEKLEWYAQRWKIETFHKILKSGCKAEESRAANRRAAGQPGRRALHSELADFLDDDDQSHRARMLRPRWGSQNWNCTCSIH